MSVSESLCSFGSGSIINNGMVKKLTWNKKLVIELCDFMICSNENCDVPVYKQCRSEGEIQDSKKRKSKQQYIHSRKKNVKHKIEYSEEETSDLDENSNDGEVKEMSDYEDSDEKEDSGDSDFEVSTHRADLGDSDWEVSTHRARTKVKEKQVKEKLPKIKKRKYQKKKKEKKTNNLSDFELMRQKNLDDKMAFLKSLKMDELVDELEETAKSIKIKRERPKDSGPKPKLEASRKSKRMENITINYSEAALETKVYDNAAASYVKRASLPLVYSFEDALHGDQKLSKAFHSYFDSDFGNLLYQGNTTSNTKFSHDLGCYDSIAYDSCTYPFRVSSITFHPSENKTIMMAGSTTGHIHLWNINSDPYLFAPHTDYVSLVKSNPKCPSKIVSSSYDGTMRQTDLEKKCFIEIFKEDIQCNSFDCVSPSEFLVAQSNGCVSLVDTRTKRSRSGSQRGAATQWKCSSESIRSISAHPTKTEMCLSLDSLGLMKVWDMRAQTTSVTQKTIICEASTDPNVLFATFSPVTGNSILCSSKLSVSLYDSSRLEKILKYQWKIDIQHTSNKIVEDPFNLKKYVPSHSRRYSRKGKWRERKFNSGCSSLFHDTGYHKFYTMADWIPNSDSAFLVSNNFLEKVMILNSDKGKEMSHFKTRTKVNFQAVHPVHNMFAITFKTSENSITRLYLKDDQS